MWFIKGPRSQDTLILHLSDVPPLSLPSSSCSESPFSSCCCCFLSSSSLLSAGSLSYSFFCFLLSGSSSPSSASRFCAWSQLCETAS